MYIYIYIYILQGFALPPTLSRTSGFQFGCSSWDLGCEVWKLVSKVFALDHMVSVPHPDSPLKLDYRALKTWDDVRQASKIEYKWQAILLSSIKIFGLHALQPCLFVLPYLAYSSSMGWVQFFCATVVLVNEIWYLFIIAYGFCLNAKWLLYAPLSDTQDPLSMGIYTECGAATYLCAPALFIMDHCWAAYSEPFHEFALEFSGLYGLFASVNAWVAILIGFIGHGAIFPSLLVGYMLSALELLCYLLYCCGASDAVITV